MKYLYLYRFLIIASSFTMILLLLGIQDGYKQQFTNNLCTLEQELCSSTNNENSCILAYYYCYYDYNDIYNNWVKENILTYNEKLTNIVLCRKIYTQIVDQYPYLRSIILYSFTSIITTIIIMINLLVK